MIVLGEVWKKALFSVGGKDFDADLICCYRWRGGMKCFIERPQVITRQLLLYFLVVSWLHRSAETCCML